MFDRPTRRRNAGGSFISTVPGVLLAAVALAGAPSCGGEPPADTRQESVKTKRPISDVLKDHAPELMALDGVVGVYEGALPGGEGCVVVMLSATEPVPRKDIPGSIEGYPVRLEFGGEVKPMR